MDANPTGKEKRTDISSIFNSRFFGNFICCRGLVSKNTGARHFLPISLASLLFAIMMVPFLLPGHNLQTASAQEQQLQLSTNNIDNSTSNLTFKEIFAKTKDSVVQVEVTFTPAITGLQGLPGGGNNSNNTTPSLPGTPPDIQPGRPLPPFPSAVLGSGFIIDKEGHIITNHHVVATGGNVSVTFPDGVVYNADVIGSDPFSDIAVLKLQGDVPSDKLVPIPLGNSSNLSIGDEAVAIGSPFGLSGSLSTGVISGLGRLLPSGGVPGGVPTLAYSIPNVIQTDTAINPGNSGGPLLDMKGEVVGMNTAILSSSGFYSGIGFAIPSNTLAKIVPSLIVNGSYAHPWIGIAGIDVTPQIASELDLKEARGFLVVDVIPDSPADKFGIRGGDMPIQSYLQSPVPGVGGSPQIELGGDIILKVDDKEIRKVDDLLAYIEGEKSVGDSVTLTVLRDAKITEIDLVLAARPGSSS